jgi:hypothetical protein
MCNTARQVQYIAGGATQNAIRVAQWMIQVREWGGGTGGWMDG